MSKEKEELDKILKNLERFADRTKSCVLALVLRSLPEKEAEKFYIAGDEVHWLIKGNTTITLELVRRKFAKELKRLAERDKTMLRDIEKREKAKKK